MSGTTGLEVDGLDIFNRTTAAAAADLANLHDAHAEAGQLLVGRARPRTRRDTGALADGVDYEADAHETTLLDDVDYAVFVHAYDPWLAETLDDSQQAVVDVFIDEIEHVVSTIHGT